MSISLGLYDLFGNAVPGLLYLYILNECAKLLGLSGVDFSKIDGTAQLLGIIFLGYILGQVFNVFTYRSWFKLWIRKNNREYALNRIRARYPSELIRFDVGEADLLIAIIQHNDLNISEKIESLRVNAILMRNFSFGFFLHGLLYGAKIIISGVSTASILVLVISFIFSWIAIYRAKDFDWWFYRDVFQEALVYGNSLQEVLDSSRLKTIPQKIDNKVAESSKK
jgi:hypothetical protein